MVIDDRPLHARLLRVDCQQHKPPSKDGPMLAVQQAPRMGSTQPESDPLLPFGYSVDPAQEPLFDAPDPAPGAPLLSESDSKLLSSFFEDMTANQYNMPSFGEGLNFSDAWLDLPPQFMGTATSYGPHATPPLDPSVQQYPGASSSGHPDRNIDLQRMMSGSHLMPPPPPPPHPQSFHQQHSDDVLNAAATLLQNGSASRTSAPKSNDSPLSRRSVGYPVGHLRHQPLEEFREENRRSSTGTEHDNTFAEWGYTPETDKDSLEAMQQAQRKYLECLEVGKSATDPRPSSPTNGRAALDNRDSSIYVKREEDPAAPPRKRRKSENSGWKRRSKAERTGSSPPADAAANGRRRKSTANGAKPPRENLSEEQKRENHIRSEQKRRTLIKEGFDDLGELVPGLKGGGFSKSTTLSMAAEWLEDLVRGNKTLSAQLAALDGK
ncbi:helix-loop-helix DNA-binding domain-containing protein [Hirsutella rhossiliensis]|uniref:Helix-loop-helix DNA-binding domain-containing protein n=1 Tax=Hirsutella rhossiliensis TaxID=111463 RepID=A0A9P8N507_9HYPO|nr:helix-loop-helix DNA-binding domain-containing protein [Hirsutella rhossiliensis]KAH0967050.1 helix-loop-helix DNA-binding domain-containing protein [Hirsutella rhossiliensis]